MKKRRRENGKKDYLAGRRPKSGARTRKPDGYCGVSMKKTWTVLLAVLLLLGCAGCGARPAQAGTGALSGESSALNLNLGGDPQTLDPAYAAEQNGSYLAHLFEGLLTYNEDLELVPGAAESWLLSESEEIEKTAQRILDENNTGYTAKVSLEKLYIPRKTYDGIILPEGSYEGFMVRLGKSEGENWWCVVYPPLCFTEEVCGELSDEAKEYLRQTLPAESYNLITGDGISIKYKFKIVELLQKAEKNFSKK